MEPVKAVRRRQRIEELRNDLQHKKPERVAHARKMLLTMLWLEEETTRREIFSILCRYLPEPEQPFPEAALRLSRQYVAPRIEEPTTAVAVDTLLAALNNAVRVILDIAIQALRAMLAGNAVGNSDSLYLETDVCRDCLLIAHGFHLPQIVEPTVQILRLFHPDLARDTGPLARQTGPLREAASHLLGALSPDDLYAYWYALGSPDKSARRDLLPVLDYLNDTRATPYLIRLFERRSQWSDGEMVGWFAVRAFKRLHDRRALPALRRLLSAVEAGHQAAMTPHTGPDLVREVRRTIEAIQYGRSGGAKEELLRPSQAPVDNLLRSSSQSHLDLGRSADPQAQELLRSSPAPQDNLLRPVDTAISSTQELSHLLRPDPEPDNPFENFDPHAEF
jgi:hypothetical protein